jgi:hypothetical protein
MDDLSSNVIWSSPERLWITYRNPADSRKKWSKLLINEHILCEIIAEWFLFGSTIPSQNHLIRLGARANRWNSEMLIISVQVIAVSRGNLIFCIPSNIDDLIASFQQKALCSCYRSRTTSQNSEIFEKLILFLQFRWEDEDSNHSQSESIWPEDDTSGNSVFDSHENIAGLLFF